MRQNVLGSTGIKVSELCFGTLTLGPLQKNLPVDKGAYLLNMAYDKGVTFFDSADMYETYPYLRELLKSHPDAVVCSRSYDYTYDGVIKRLDKALRALGRDYIDLFLLHEQESKFTFEGHADAFKALIDAKAKGKIRATGFSTHRIEAVRDSLDYPELEVVFALLNKEGLGIEDGTAGEMLEAIVDAHKTGKGIYTMKPLGGGNLIGKRSECLTYQKDLLESGIITSVALGMGSSAEVLYNTRFFNGEAIEEGLSKESLGIPRRLHIDDWCERCGSCIARCHQKALSFKKNKVVIDHSRCLRCGYCAGVCPVFAIKIV